MWELNHKESWAPKKWCFWTVVLEKTLESPLDCKEIKAVRLKEINPEYSLEWLMLKLKLQYFGHLMQTANSLERPSCWERLKAEVEKGNRAWEGWMASPVVLIIPYYKIITFLPLSDCLIHFHSVLYIYILVQHLHILINIHLQFLLSANRVSQWLAF